MSDQWRLTGVVIGEFPLGDNDKRLTLLSRERGKVSLIAKGCRKTASHLHALAQVMILGEFQVSAGRSYNYLNSGRCLDSFGFIREDLDRILYGTYFCEVCSYFTLEGQVDKDILNLLLLTFSAMKKDLIPLSQIRRIFEFTILRFAGYGMETGHCVSCGKEPGEVGSDEAKGWAVSYRHGGICCPSCGAGLYADPLNPRLLPVLQFLRAAPMTRIYSFRLGPGVLEEFEKLIDRYFAVQADHRFRSAVMLDSF